MENNDRKKYLKKLKTHNTILVVIMIIAAVMLIYRVSYYIQENNYRKSKYYDYYFSSLDPYSSRQAFVNNNFRAFEGSQTGSLLYALFQRLIDNARTYQDEASKIPKVEYRSSDGEVIYSDNRMESVAYEEPSEEKSFKKLFFKYDYDELERRIRWEEEAKKQDKMIDTEFIENDGFNSYLEGLSNIKSKINYKHKYEVEFEYKWDHIIKRIIISE